MTTGITFSGESFAVPVTNDMVKTLFDPSVRKLFCELIILFLLAANTLVFLFVGDNVLRIRIFVALYAFWRLSYNFGIGYLLHQQSNRFKLVKWSEQLGLFEDPPRSIAGKFAQKEVSSQMGPEYELLQYPLAFNTWLIFRKIVDLILMSDFTTFVCLVVACCIDNDYQFVRGQPQWLIVSRLVVGGILIVFNLWVKVNAHNTIKDYAWYWGDFFFRQINNEDLIFDGVFEMFPHPMYSVGYIGYYGFALIAKSYTVLVVAICGHFLQMVFLHFIENPHIEKIYGPLPSENSLRNLLKLKDLSNFDNARPLVGLVNFNLLRASDVINAINCVTYSLFIPLLAYFSAFNAPAVAKVLFSLTVFIKGVESVAINTTLILQSRYKTFTRWYLANNVSLEKSLNNFAILYNSLGNLTYASFAGMNLFRFLTGLKYDLFFSEYTNLRFFMGVLLIATQVWINTSIIDLLGYFGWFYGDFFIPKSSFMAQRPHLTKAGVYRYLNNPEQVFGVCGVMGVTLMVPTYDNLVICVMWTLNNFFRINFVEKQHMIRIYGESAVLQDSGVTKTVKKHLLPEVIQEKLRKSEPRKRRVSMIDSFDAFFREFSVNFGVDKLSLADMSQHEHFANGDYKVAVEGLTPAMLPFAYVGETLVLHFEAPSGHSAKDWVGLYKITHTSSSRYRTLISSNSRWDWTGDATVGTITFSKNKLYWEDGVYEFRYHLDGKHDVTLILAPFELRYREIGVPVEQSGAEALAQQLKECIFEKVVGPIDNVDLPIYPLVSQTDDAVATYSRIALLIAECTGVKVSKRFLIYNDNESGNTFTLRMLAVKLIHIRSALCELEEDDLTKKMQ